MPKLYRDFSPTEFDCRGLGLSDRQDWYVAATKTRDSCPIDVTNFRAILERLGGPSDTVEFHTFGHWACGHFDLVLVHAQHLPELTKMLDRLENYGVLDEDALSEYESEQMQVAWAAWGCRDFLRHLDETCQLSGYLVWSFLEERPWDAFRLFEDYVLTA